MITEPPGTQAGRTLRTAVTTVGKIDDPDPALARQYAVHRLAGQLGGAGPAGAGVAVELADHPVQRAQRGIGGQPHPEHRDPLVALASQRPAAADLVTVEAAGETVRGARL